MSDMSLDNYGDGCLYLNRLSDSEDDENYTVDSYPDSVPRQRPRSGDDESEEPANFRINLSKRCQGARAKKWRCDVSITCGARTFPAHGYLLKLSIPYFREEAGSLDAPFDLTDTPVNSLALDVVLKIVYGERVNLKDIDCMNLHRAAYFLRIQDLAAKCLAEMSENKTVDAVLGILEYTKTASVVAPFDGAEDLLAGCWKFLHNNWKETVSRGEFLSLDHEDVRKILLQRDGSLLAEERLYLEAVLIWVEDNVETRSAQLSSLLEVIDFSEIDYADTVNSGVFQRFMHSRRGTDSVRLLLELLSSGEEGRRELLVDRYITHFTPTKMLFVRISSKAVGAEHGGLFHSYNRRVLSLTIYEGRHDVDTNRLQILMKNNVECEYQQKIHTSCAKNGKVYVWSPKTHGGNAISLLTEKGSLETLQEIPIQICRSFRGLPDTCYMDVSKGKIWLMAIIEPSYAEKVPSVVVCCYGAQSAQDYNIYEYPLVGVEKGAQCRLALLGAEMWISGDSPSAGLPFQKLEKRLPSAYFGPGDLGGMATPHHWPGTLVHDGKVFIAGGQGSKVVEAFDLADRQWSLLPPLHGDYVRPCLAAVGTCLYVTDGEQQSDVSLTGKMEWLDLLAGNLGPAGDGGWRSEDFPNPESPPAGGADGGDPPDEQQESYGSWQYFLPFAI